jgi:CubicO group peptidase (beta-lactamase class C family)
MAFTEPDKTTFAVGLGQDDPPGKVWNYNNSAIQTLSPLLEKATGEKPVDMGQERIFDAIDMNDSEWTTDDAGNSMTFSGINSTCLDLARFGRLMQNGGTWNGKRLISKDYVEQATGGKSSDLNAAYGLLWWVNHKGPVLGANAALGGQADEPVERLAPRAPDDAFWALGAGRQMIGIIPSKDIVFVRMGAMPANPESITPDSLTGDVLDALR